MTMKTDRTFPSPKWWILLSLPPPLLYLKERERLLHQAVVSATFVRCPPVDLLPSIPFISLHSCDQKYLLNSLYLIFLNTLLVLCYLHLFVHKTPFMCTLVHTHAKGVSPIGQNPPRQCYIGSIVSTTCPASPILVLTRTCSYGPFTPWSSCMANNVRECVCVCVLLSIRGGI